MKTKFALALLLAALASTVWAQTPEETNQFLAMLDNADMEVRIEGLRGLQTSLDPRIPAASLKLLSDEGNSIRRLAARAVGSRYFQIPDADKPRYLAALRPLLKSEHDDEANMARRAIGLLSWKFDGDMFSVSPKGHWVIYERFSLPCLIDTRNRTEELLGWAADESGGDFAPVWGNGTLADCAFWTKDGAAVALNVITSRKSNVVWVWEETGSRLIKLDERAMILASGIDPATIQGGGGFFTEIKGWEKNELQIECSFMTRKGEDEFIDHTAVLGWSRETGKFRKISLTSEPG